jgi:hypothetical protein
LRAICGGAAASFSGEWGGLQSALLRERMRYAFEHECDLAMMVALPGSDSQRIPNRLHAHEMEIVFVR